ncbi:MAG: hypothetical protein JW941_01895, partial [Candidatus Coatesbacteria bacterium]|nr:hypothetical protein [Candidatus Coatesbacteria bacterium]
FDGIVTWLPEALYRYLLILPGENADADLLQECMLNEYYYAGVSLIDSLRYSKYFGSTINSAHVVFEEQKEKYLKSIEEGHAERFERAFTRTPDLEKAQFVNQMGWKLLRTSELREREANERIQEARAEAAQAKRKAKMLEAQRDAAWRKKAKVVERQLEATERHLHDPKHIRKRERQAKKRRKKK